jgi:aspartyl-tRNA(Asn)/glutamyl-tRNA(Gln) amidotransferase subunit B
MEKGAMRFEANISLRQRGTDKLSDTRVEIKNLNSLRAMVHATEFEIARQKKIWESGGTVEQETMGWDEARNVTVTQRSKEEAHDYRYFPEPDLPSLQISRAWVDEIRAKLPELPDEKRDRLIHAFGLSAYDAGVITAEKEIADYYDRAVADGKSRGADPKSIANWVTGELFRLMKEANSEIGGVKIAPAQIGELIALVQSGKITSTIAKQVFEAMFATGKSPQAIVDEKGLAVIGEESALEPIIAQVIAQNAEAVENYRAGKETVLKFLVGQVMRASKGQANPNLAADLLRKKINT